MHKVLGFLQGLFVRALGGQLGQKLLTLLPFTVLYLLHIVYSAAVLINLLGCFWLFTGKVLEDPHTSWLASVGEHFPVDIHNDASIGSGKRSMS